MRAIFAVVLIIALLASALASRRLTRTVPIVVPDSADPVGVGLVQSLARPGANITGLTIMSPQPGGKRLELLKETFPKISQVAMVIKTADPHRLADVKEMKIGAQELGVQLHVVAVQEVNDI